MKLLLVDGNSILNRAFYGVKPLSNQKGVFTNAVFGFFNILSVLTYLLPCRSDAFIQKLCSII